MLKRLLTVQKVLGLLLILFSVSMLPPAIVALIYRDGALLPFLYAFALILGIGLLNWLIALRASHELRVRDGFLVVVLFWVVLGLSGALPFWLSSEPTLSLTDSVFESISGLTTTGATVILGIDDLPHSMLWYRQQLQWLGGMGIIVLAVAVLPMLGIGGMQLYRAEMPGPMKETKLTPRITETAKALWYIYFWLTVICAFTYWLAGMDGFDAIGHAFSTIAIGGFSTHDDSMGYFDSTWIEMIAVVFMLLAGMNFALHFVAFRRRSLFVYGFDSELRFYLFLMITVTTIVTLALFLHRHLSELGALLHPRPVPDRLDWHHHWLYHRCLLLLAAVHPDPADLSRLCRRLRGLDWRRHQGDPVAVADQAGTARDRAPDPSKRATAGACGWQSHQPSRHRCGLGLFLALCRDLHADVSGAGRNRVGSDHGLLGRGRLHE